MAGYIEQIYRLKDIGNCRGKSFSIEDYQGPEIPDNTTCLEIRELYLKELPKLPSKLRVLLLYDTSIEKWPTEFPPGFVELGINGGFFPSIPKIPSLKAFRCKHAEFKKASLSGLSKKLEVLDIRGAGIKSVPELSKRLTILDLSSNSITKFPNFSYLKKLYILDLSGNPISSFSKGLPPATTEVYLRLSEKVVIPDYIKKINLK